MIGLFGIILSLGLLMFLAYRGITVLILAPILALVAVVFSGEGAVVLGTYTQVFMQSLGSYVVKYFPLFLLGAVFGKLMDDSGSARTIARWLVAKLGKHRSLLAIVLACAILTYGGVSLFVVGFAVYPIAAALFREANLPKRFIPGAITLGALTFTMTALPGTPAIQNAIPMPFFNTDAFAAPFLGIIGGLIMLFGGIWWLSYRINNATETGEGYGNHQEEIIDIDTANDPSICIALLPIVLVIGTNFVLSKYLLPLLDTAYLAEAKYGATSFSSVLGIWAIICALVIACLVLIITNWKRWKNLKKTINQGTLGSLLPIFNTASEVGYGSVIASLGSFILVRDFLVGLSPNNPLISEAIVVNVLAGITGSASGGLSIALNTMSETYLNLAAQFNISPELLHRIASMASGGFDALPHNGAVITLLAICGLSHRESYPDIGMVAVVIPLAALAVVITLGTIFGSF